MNIKSKLTNYSWMVITIDADNTEIIYNIDTIKEAESLKEELIEVINDIDTYIEKMKNRIS